MALANERRYVESAAITLRIIEADLNSETGVGSQPLNTVSFYVRLGSGDWLPTIASWHCEALNLPGSSVREAFAEGKQIDQRKFKIGEGRPYIQWDDAAPAPNHVAFLIVVDLEARNKLQRDKDRAERREIWWRRFAIVVPIVVACIALVSTNFHRIFPVPGPAHTEKFRSISKMLAPLDSAILNHISALYRACGGGSGTAIDNYTRTRNDLNDIRSTISDARVVADTAAQRP